MTKRTNSNFAFNETCPTWLRSVIRDAVAEGLAKSRSGPAPAYPKLRQHWAVMDDGTVQASHSEFAHNEGEVVVRLAASLHRDRAVEHIETLLEHMRHALTDSVGHSWEHPNDDEVAF